VARPDAFAVYAEAERLAGALTAAGNDDWAGRLTEAIAAGSTSGEILMALRYQLEALERDRSIGADLRSEAKRVRRQVARCFSWR